MRSEICRLARTLIAISLAYWHTGYAQSAGEHPALNDSSIRYQFSEYKSRDDTTLSKVFVLGSWQRWSWSTRPSYESALKHALETCDESGTSPCRLFAVGNTIVWDMNERERSEVIAAYRSSHSEIAATSRKINSPEFLENYKKINDGSNYKVLFLATDGGTFVWTQRATYETAVDEAQAICERRAKSRECKLYAVVNTVVWDLNEDQRHTTIEAYVLEVSIPEVLKRHPGAGRGFKRYESEKLGWGYKAFALASNGAWSWRQRSTMDGTITDALLSCEVFAKGPTCKLFALGDVIVWDLSEQELESVKEKLASEK